MRHRRLPVTAGDRHGVPRRVFAPQRGAWCIGQTWCTGLFLDFRSTPSPRRHRSDDGLRALVHVNVLDDNLLLALAAVARECFDKRRIGAHELWQTPQRR